MRGLTILYLGAFAPDVPEHRNDATSRAAMLFQTGFLDAMLESDLPNPDVRCYFPVESFPRGRLLCLPVDGRLPNGLAMRSLAHFNLGALKILTLGLSAAWAALVWGLQNRGRRRVVISYNLNAPPAWLVGPVCRLLGIKFVPFVGDIYVPGEVVSGGWLRRLEFALQRRAVPRADGLLVCNKSIIDDFAPGRDHLLVEGGVSSRFVSTFANSGTPREEFHIVFAGQLSELNGVTVLIDAMRLISDPGVRVTILGGGALEHVVRSRSFVDYRIKYHGLVPHSAVLDHYANADLLVNLRATSNATHRYVFPSKVVECLATGIPLLSTRTGHVDTQFGDFVFLLDALNPEALAARIMQIKAMPRSERLAFGERARRYVAEHKTWEAHMRNISEYLETHVFPEDRAA